MLEFTGERVVPGLVDPNLLNEHLARYRFAARFAAGAVVLDAGCGTGYGGAEFVEASSVVGIDLSAEAAGYAENTYGRAGVRFLQADCTALPFADGVFDLVVAFEVIEHLGNWRALLEEARRVLRPGGILLVSTPNKAYYAETRAAAGPNPFHVHEFEYGEFGAALAAVFPHVCLWSQNHSESIVFAPEASSEGVLDAPGDAAPENAHFFLAACSQSRIADTGAFAWLPQAGNVLRERERHIALLEAELKQKTAWLQQTGDSHAALQQAHEELLQELRTTQAGYERQIGDLEKELKTAHAGLEKQIAAIEEELNTARAGYAKQITGLEEELKTAHVRYEARIAGLEGELKTVHDGYEERIAILEQEAVTRLAWVGDLEAQIARGRREIARLNLEQEGYKTSILERQGKVEALELELQRANEALGDAQTKAAYLETEQQRLEAARGALEAENAALRDERRLIAGSKWLRLGRKLGLGPVVESD